MSKSWHGLIFRIALKHGMNDIAYDMAEHLNLGYEFTIECHNSHLQRPYILNYILHHQREHEKSVPNVMSSIKPIVLKQLYEMNENENKNNDQLAYYGVKSSFKHNDLTHFKYFVPKMPNIQHDKMDIIEKCMDQNRPSMLEIMINHNERLSDRILTSERGIDNIYNAALNGYKNIIQLIFVKYYSYDLSNKIESHEYYNIGLEYFFQSTKRNLFYTYDAYIDLVGSKLPKEILDIVTEYIFGKINPCSLITIRKDLGLM